jgi:hypothetical protein
MLRFAKQEKKTGILVVSSWEDEATCMAMKIKDFLFLCRREKDSRGRQMMQAPLERSLRKGTVRVEQWCTIYLFFFPGPPSDPFVNRKGGWIGHKLSSGLFLVCFLYFQKGNCVFSPLVRSH